MHVTSESRPFSIGQQKGITFDRPVCGGYKIVVDLCVQRNIIDDSWSCELIRKYVSDGDHKSG